MHHRKLLNDFPLYPGLKYKNCTDIDGSTPPKKIRITTYHDCPTAACCKLATNTGKILFQKLLTQPRFANFCVNGSKNAICEQLVVESLVM